MSTTTPDVIKPREGTCRRAHISALARSLDSPVGQRPRRRRIRKHAAELHRHSQQVSRVILAMLCDRTGEQEGARLHEALLAEARGERLAPAGAWLTAMSCHVDQLVRDYKWMNATILRAQTRLRSRARPALRRWWKELRFRALNLVDDIALAHRDRAYGEDRYGVYANPQAPLWLRADMALLARLMRSRDGESPRWQRQPGERPAI